MATTTNTTREEAALDVLLRAAIAHGRQKPPAEPELTWHGDIKATLFRYRDPKTIPTRRQSEVTDLFDDPVGAALRQAVRRIGEHLYALAGNTGLMHEVIDCAAARDPAHEGWRGTVMDHAWNGIGHGADLWCS